MVNQEIMKLCHKLIECFNMNDLNCSEFDKIVDANVKYYNLDSPEKPKNLAAFKKGEQGYIRAFPDKKTIIDKTIIGENDQIICCWTTKGTHKGEFYGTEATNKEFEISGISIWRFSNNKLIEAWQTWDRLGLLEQIGTIHLSRV